MISLGTSFISTSQWAKSLKPDKPHQPNLVSMHFTSSSTCMNFLSWFYFLTPWTIAMVRREILPFWGQVIKDQNLRNRRSHTPTKFGFYAFHINLYLHEFFELILFFDPMDYSPWSEGKFWPFWGQVIKDQNLRNRRSHTNQIWFLCISHQPLLVYIFELILFFDPHGL